MYKFASPVLFAAVVFFSFTAHASVELCSELISESYELEEFKEFLNEWESSKDDGGALDNMKSSTARVEKTSRLIAADVFSSKYERELARSVKSAAGDVEAAITKEDAAMIYPAYEVMMETIDYLTKACFEEPE